MKLNQAVSKRLRDILDEKGITQYELFKISGVPRSTIGNVINCTYDSVKLRIIHEICMGLNMSIAEFFNSEYFHIDNLDD